VLREVPVPVDRVYYDALERLKNGRPVNVPKGTKITNDAVSVEAGKKKGSIKRSRPVFSNLIEVIDKAAAEQASPGDEMTRKLAEAKADTAKYRALWEEALTREVSLVKELWDEREGWAKEKAAIHAGKVASINSKNTRGAS